MVVNNTHKQAAKAALGLMVATRGAHPELAGLGVGEAAVTMGLQLGDMDSASALVHYAYGVQTQGERVSNRKWAQYPQAVKRLAYQVANQAAAEIDALLS